jgi:hypothetical protein
MDRSRARRSSADGRPAPPPKAVAKPHSGGGRPRRTWPGTATRVATTRCRESGPSRAFGGDRRNRPLPRRPLQARPGWTRRTLACDRRGARASSARRVNRIGARAAFPHPSLGRGPPVRCGGLIFPVAESELIESPPFADPIIGKRLRELGAAKVLE